MSADGRTGFVAVPKHETVRHAEFLPGVRAQDCEGGEAMSMLSMQADELRKMAVNLGVNGVCTGDLSKLYVMLREAADTIESLRDRLQESYGRVPEQVKRENEGERESCATQECHATQANYEHCKYSTNRGWRDTSRYSELFGTPERAARTLADWGVDARGYNALLDWLRGEV